MVWQQLPQHGTIGRVHYIRGRSRFPVDAHGLLARVIRINRLGRPVVLPLEWADGFEFSVSPHEFIVSEEGERD